jgi:hypothetical protein
MILRAAFLLLKYSILIIHMCVCLLCVEISDTKAFRKFIARNNYFFLSLIPVEFM